jgi:hypothetical protein
VEDQENWNRDLMAVMNFRRIWWGHMNGLGRPMDLCRGNNVQEEEDDGNFIL